MKLSHDFISNHIKQWINAWNSKDMELILSLYSDNIEFSSPKIKKLFSGYDINIIKDKIKFNRLVPKATFFIYKT